MVRSGLPVGYCFQKISGSAVGVTKRQIFQGRAPLPFGRHPRPNRHRGDQPQPGLGWEADAGDGQPADQRLGREVKG